MITLTTPAVINSIIGGNAPINYDKFVLSNIRMDPISGNITANVLMSSISNPQMDAITGSLNIDWNSKRVIMQVERLDFYKSANLTAGQQNAVTTIIADAQSALESGMISLGFVAGTQSAGV